MNESHDQDPLNGAANGDPAEFRKPPNAVIKRLSLYSRVLQDLEFAHVEKVSSAEIARNLGLNSSQVRKDLAYFGQFGVPGFGYVVEDLRKKIRSILGKDREVHVILIGVGNLGSALLSYKGFLKEGFTMMWGFDVDPEAARGRSRTDVPIYHVDEMEDRLVGKSVDIAVLAVPAAKAQETADRVIELGIHAILNFVPAHLQIPDFVSVRYVDLALELENLSFYLRDEESVLKPPRTQKPN